MLLKYFNSNRINIIVFVSLLQVVYWIPSWFPAFSLPAPEPSGIPLGKWILAFNREFRIIASMLALVLVLINGYLLIHLNTIHNFIPYRTQLPAYFYALLVLGMTQLHQLTPALVASSILIAVFFRIFSAYKVDGVSLNFLDAGLLIAMASLVFFPAIVFFLFLVAGLFFLRPFQWREWVYALIGLALPYVFLFSVYYLLDMPVSGYFTDVRETLTRFEQPFKRSQMVNWAYVLFWVLTGSYFLAVAMDAMKIHARKFFLVFLFFFLISLLIYAFLPGAGMGMGYYAAIPLSYLFTFYFVKGRRSWINELAFAVFLLLLLWQRW